MQPIDITQPTQSFLDTSLFEPTYFLNIEYIFDKIFSFIKSIFIFLINSKTWDVITIILGIITIISIAIIIFSIIRIVEIQTENNKKLNDNINKAFLQDKEKERNANPRWHYILTLIESSNESDWRVAIIEADTMMEEILKERGLSGETLSELLESAKSSGYTNIQNAWDAHLVRNQIAHQGLDFPLSQIEGRRVIKMFQNFFEGLGVI